MAIETVSVALTDSAWTALKTTQTEVTVTVRDRKHVAIHAATSLPAANEADFHVIDDYMAFSGLAATDIIYARAVHGSATVDVTRL